MHPYYHRYPNTECSKDAGFKKQGKTNKLNNNNKKTSNNKNAEWQNI